MSKMYKNDDQRIVRKYSDEFEKLFYEMKNQGVSLSTRELEDFFIFIFKKGEEKSAMAMPRQDSTEVYTGE